MSIQDKVSPAKMDIVMVYSITTRKLEDLPDGAKIKTKTLVDDLSKETGCTVSLIRSIVTAVVQETHGITVLRGKHGGIFKGLVEKKEDLRPRCPTCQQIIRAKTKNKSSETGLTDTPTSPMLEENEEEDDESEDDTDETA